MSAKAQTDSIESALRPLYALSLIAGDRDLMNALREFGYRVAPLERAALDVARAAAVERVEELRPDLEPTEWERLVADVLPALAAEAEWPEPIPLRDHAEPRPFPLGALPQYLDKWVAAEAHATQTPPDMAAMLALAVVATCCARRMRVHVRDGWIEPACIYTAVVLPPGSRKSAVMRDARAPLDTYEREQAEFLAPEIARLKDGLAAAEKRHTRAVERAARSDGAERMAAEGDVREARAELDAARRALVAAPRLTCSDTSQEALARMLAEHSECMGLFDAEGCGPLAIMAGRYTDGSAAIDLYLRAHAGDAYRADRIGRDPIVLNQPALTMALAVQPEVLHQLGKRREMRGLGLLARILWSTPNSTVGRRIARPEPMADRTQAEYAQRVRWLLELPLDADGKPHLLRMSDAANEQLTALHERLEPRLGRGGDLEHMADWVSKLCGAVARIAGVMHAAEHADAPWAREIGVDTMRGALDIGEYLLEHARAALGNMESDPVLDDAQHVLDHLRAGEVRVISRRDLHRAVRGRFPRSADLDPALTVLAERGWIRVEVPTPRGAGRPPSPTIHASPHISCAGQNGRNGQITSPDGVSVQSVQSVHEVVL